MGRIPDNERIWKVVDWSILKTVKNVRGFLELCETVQIWIKDYFKIARPLIELVCKHIEFVWDQWRQETFDTLKIFITTASTLQSIDYTSNRSVFISFDSSVVAVGFILPQENTKDKQRSARYESLPFNEREAHYS